MVIALNVKHHHKIVLNADPDSTWKIQHQHVCNVMLIVKHVVKQLFLAILVNKDGSLHSQTHVVNVMIVVKVVIKHQHNAQNVMNLIL